MFLNKIFLRNTMVLMFFICLVSFQTNAQSSKDIAKEEATSLEEYPRNAEDAIAQQSSSITSPSNANKEVDYPRTAEDLAAAQKTSNASPSTNIKKESDYPRTAEDQAIGQSQPPVATTPKKKKVESKVTEEKEQEVVTATTSSYAAPDGTSLVPLKKDAKKTTQRQGTVPRNPEDGTVSESELKKISKKAPQSEEGRQHRDDGSEDNKEN